MCVCVYLNKPKLKCFSSLNKRMENGDKGKSYKINIGLTKMFQ